MLGLQGAGAGISLIILLGAQCIQFQIVPPGRGGERGENVQSRPEGCYGALGHHVQR